MTGTVTMARAKKDPKPKPPEPASRTTIINLKGSADQAEWLEGVHRKTHIAKSVIVRLALAEWAERNGHSPFPMEGGEGES